MEGCHRALITVMYTGNTSSGPGPGRSTPTAVSPASAPAMLGHMRKGKLTSRAFGRTVIDMFIPPNYLSQIL